MKKVILSLLLLAGCCTLAAAETSVWKAQKGSAVIYLGGTCHLLRQEDYPLPPEFETAYKSADIILLETDLGKLKESATREKFLTNAVYADGSTIDKHLSASTYGALSAYCEANGIPLQLYARFKPAMLMTALTVLELTKAGINQAGVDQFYYELAKKAGKSVVGLETVDEQINYLISMADGNEDEFVTYSLKEMKTLKEQFEILVKAWRKGDAGKLTELMVADLKAQQPQLYKKLITDRNRNWLPVIEAKQRENQTLFILVGAGHLVGPEGIIEALGKKGYKVSNL